MISNSDQYRNS